MILLINHLEWKTNQPVAHLLFVLFQSFVSVGDVRELHKRLPVKPTREIYNQQDPVVRYT